VPFLRERRDVLETFVFSKMWFVAQIIPLPQGVASRATSLAGASFGEATMRGWPDVPTGGSRWDPGWASGLLAWAGGGSL
jgi:hypothetical protein